MGVGRRHGPMAGVCNIGYSTRLLKKSSAIERSNKGGFRSEVFISYFSKKPNRRPGARSALSLRGTSEGTPYDAANKHL